MEIHVLALPCLRLAVDARIPALHEGRMLRSASLSACILSLYL